MRKRIVFALLAVLLVAALAANVFSQSKSAGKGAGDKPIAVVKDMTVDLGEVLEGSDIDYSFVIRNAGNVDLQVLNVKPT